MNNKLSTNEEVEYPENWPAVPNGFELDETTSFVQGGEELIYKSDVFDFRISTHQDGAYSGTVRVGEEYEDFRFKSENSVIDWLSGLFELYKESIIVRSSPMGGDIIGVNEECTVIEYEQGVGVNGWVDKLDKLNPYKGFPVHNPRNIGEHKATIKINYVRDQYMYVFDNHVINIFGVKDGNRYNEVFPIPDINLIFKHIKRHSDMDNMDFEIVHYSESIQTEDIVKKFI